jgi:hypothetical protein
MTYTHSAGVRNRCLEFSQAILDDNKSAGILTRLDEDGIPVISGLSNLGGVTVVDLPGFRGQSGYNYELLHRRILC